MMLPAAMAALATLALVSTACAQQASSQDGCAAYSKAFADAQTEARSLEASGRTAEAVGQFEEAYRVCPEEAESGRELVSAEIAAGEVDAAEMLLRGLIQKQDRAEWHSLMGEVLAAKQDFKGAAAQYQIGAKMQPSESSVFDFGTSLMRVNFGAATEVLQYGLKAYPESVKMHIGLALAMYAQDRAEEGAKLFCEAADLDPLDVHPMEALADTGVVPRAMQAEVLKRLDGLRALYPDDGLILFDDAMVRSGRWSGDPAATPAGFESALQQALAFNPKLSKAYFQLALVDEQKKDYAAEITALKQAIAMDADAEQLHYKLAFAYRASGDLAGFQRELAAYTALHARASHAH